MVVHRRAYNNYVLSRLERCAPFCGLILSLGLIALSLPPTAIASDAAYGRISTRLDGSTHRESWALPTQRPGISARAFVYRPMGKGPFPLVLIAHASTQNAVSRAQMPQPDYRLLAMALVARGFAVIIPERPGHGVTGGAYLEDQGGCENADYTHAARATADSILAALRFMRQQTFIAKQPALVVGHSAGGWGALALASHSPSEIRAIIAFAPGRGGHANNRPGEICATDRLVEAARTFGRNARIPVIWLVAQNDSYFPPAFSQRMADAFRAGGGKADFRILPVAGDDGHWLAETSQVTSTIGDVLQSLAK